MGAFVTLLKSSRTKFLNHYQTVIFFVGDEDKSPKTAIKASSRNHLQALTISDKNLSKLFHFMFLISDYMFPQEKLFQSLMRANCMFDLPIIKWIPIFEHEIC